MGWVAFVKPVYEFIWHESLVFGRVKPGHDRENSSWSHPVSNARDFLGRVSEMLKGFRGDDKVITLCQEKS